MNRMRCSDSNPINKPAHAAPTYELRQANKSDREAIYEMRHEVYAREIGQHRENQAGRLEDSLDDSNVYLVACRGNQLEGFISITPPGTGRYSIDKYFKREELPFDADAGLYEIRLLTVNRNRRGTKLAALLMYGAFRWVEAHGGKHVMAIGRHEVLSVYQRAGLKDCGMVAQSGAVTYHLMHAGICALREVVDSGKWPMRAIEGGTRWNLSIPMRKPASCFHGGAFFEAIGPRFDQLEAIPNVINADVLDAWFPPAPAVMESINKHLPWLLRTSPPTACEGLVQTIACARRVAETCILPGAGSSDLIFRALPLWLKPSSRVLLLDPTYGEYAHMLENVIGCQVDRLTLRRENDYKVPLDTLAVALSQPYDLVVLVNPNSPTGQHLTAQDLKKALACTRPSTRVWIDETYIDFVSPEESLESFAATSENVIVCKSMSKAYALSGTRVAYLCASPHQLEELRALTPPWAVSLVAQLAAVRALESTDYYKSRWHETASLRQQLAAGLSALGWDVIPGVANFLLCHLPEGRMNAVDVVTRCRKHQLFLRDATRMGAQIGNHALRVAVKDAATNQRTLAILSTVWSAS